MDDSGGIHGAVVGLQTQIAALTGQVAQLDQHLFKGNGRPGVMTRTARNEDAIERLELLVERFGAQRSTNWRAVGVVCTSVLGAAGAIVGAIIGG